MRRRLTILLALGIAAGGCGGGGGAGSASAPPPVRTTTRSLTTTAVASTLRAPRAHHHRRHPAAPRIDPGTLPQTPQLPSAHTATFDAEMQALWTAVRTGSGPAGHPAFFPERAYAQLKAIGDPAGDYAGRLVRDFDLDVAAAHALLGPGAARARLLAVRVPAGFAHWVGPDVCLNRVGYWEVPNARMVYDQGGQTRSFGIASMISWRGVWYVVHLGAILRSTAGGMVDEPSAGEGTSAPSSTC